MGTFETFLLFIAAFVGTVMFITNPLQKLTKQMSGKKKSEIEADIMESDKTAEIVVSSCGFIFLILLYNFIIEPLAVISALINKIGYQPIAYLMLAIIALGWIQSAYSITKNKTNKPQCTVVTSDGKKVEGTIVETDEKIKIKHPFWLFVKRIFFFLPTLYLWYLFLVLIGVINF